MEHDTRSPDLKRQFRNAFSIHGERIGFQRSRMAAGKRQIECSCFQKKRCGAKFKQETLFGIFELHAAVQNVGGDDQKKASRLADRLSAVDGGEGEIAARCHSADFKVGEFRRSARFRADPLKTRRADLQKIPTGVHEQFSGFGFIDPFCFAGGIAGRKRSFLPEHGYRVEAERLTADKGKLYPILTVRGGEMPPATSAESWGGFLLGDDPLWGLYLEDRLLRLRRAAAGLARARDSGEAAKETELREVIAVLEERRREWNDAYGP